MHSKTKGDIGQALVVTQILENDCSAFIDFGDNSKIDLIVEDKEGKLHKIQVKYYKRDNSSENITSLYIKKSGPNYRFRYEEKDVDWFAVVDSKTKKIAWVSAKEALQFKSSMKLSHDVKASNQRSFDDYVIFPFGEGANIGIKTLDTLNGSGPVTEVDDGAAF